MKHLRSLLSSMFSLNIRKFILNTLTVALIFVSIGTSYAKIFSFTITDPLGDNDGEIDVVSMEFNFDNTNGAYEIILTADNASPFVGDFRINLNLFNPDTGTIADSSSFFQDALNDYSLAETTTTITLTGNHASLLTWDIGDRVAFSGPEPLGLPSGSSFFRSAVSDDVPFEGFMKNEDTIAFEKFATINISDTTLVSVLNSEVAYTQKITDRKPIYSGGINADNFILEHESTVTEVRFWGGYGEDEIPQQDFFTVHFYNDNGRCEPEVAPYASFSKLRATRSPTVYLTSPRDAVYEYLIQLPTPVNIAARKKYYFAIEFSNDTGRWGWSGSQTGSHWFSYGYSWRNTHDGNPSDLAFELKGFSVLEDPVHFTSSSLLSSNVETILNWAEIYYPQFFPPPCIITQFSGPWKYRYYPETDIYAGVNKSNEVWVLGDVFGGLLYIGTVQEMLDIISSGSTIRSGRHK